MKKLIVKTFFILKQSMSRLFKCQLNLKQQNKHQQKIETKLSHCEKEKRGEVTLFNTDDNRIVIPKSLQSDLMEWDHINLKHPSGDRMHLTLKQNFYWKGMKDMVENCVKHCKKCQLNKLPKTKHGKLPVKGNASCTQPQKRTCVDTIGPWEITITEFKKGKNGKSKKIKNVIAIICALTVVGEATSWPELVRTNDKTSLETSKMLDTTRSCRCIRPDYVVHDNCSEFATEFQELLNSYGITSQPTTVENPRPNLVKRVRRALGGVTRTEDFEDVENPMREVDVLLSSFDWTMRNTANVVTDDTPGKIVCGHGMIMQVAIEMSWNDALRRKQLQIKKNNEIENKKRSNYEFKVGDYVKIIHEKTRTLGQTNLVLQVKDHGVWQKFCMMEQ